MNARRLGFHNGDPDDEFPVGAPKEMVKAEFAKRLQKAIIDKGWTQSELADRARKFSKDGKFGRYSVSLYVRGKTLPRPDQLDAICKALGMKPKDLLPTRGVPNAEEHLGALDVKDAGGGKAWLRVNQQVDWDVAVQILQLLKHEK